MPKNLFDDLASAAPNRERFMKKMDAASATVGGGSPSATEAITETDILNFALNLEYLEAEFYTYAVEGKSITGFGIGIDGKATGENPASGGETTGGSQVTFDNNEIFSRDIAAEIGSDERAHVILLRSALGTAAVAKPNINLNALGIGFGSQVDFLTVARILEDIGVTAYTGAAGMLKTPGVITTAARLLAAEAEHAGSIHTQVAKLKIASSAVDGADLIPLQVERRPSTSRSISAMDWPQQELQDRCCIWPLECRQTPDREDSSPLASMGRSRRAIALQLSRISRSCLSGNQST